eukprot:660443-Amorphochlora_amoeboformis.AAC.3
MDIIDHLRLPTSGYLLTRDAYNKALNLVSAQPPLHVGGARGGIAITSRVSGPDPLSRHGLEPYRSPAYPVSPGNYPITIAGHSGRAGILPVHHPLQASAPMVGAPSRITTSMGMGGAYVMPLNPHTM